VANLSPLGLILANLVSLNFETVNLPVFGKRLTY